MSTVQGTVPRYLDELQTRGGLKGTDIANAIDVSKATVSRWKAGQIKPQPRHELILSDLYYVVGRLQEYYTAEEIRIWLYARHPQLNGERAIDLIHDDRALEVLKVLDRLDNEVYL
jgi:transcriptional regulator with XRE-family HTH domain